VVSLSGNWVDPTKVDLSVSEHPETVAHEEERSLEEKVNSVLGESVVKTRWLLISVSNTVSFKHPEDDETHDGNREKTGDTHTVEHGAEHSVEDHRELEVDNIGITLEEVNILSNLGSLGGSKFLLFSLSPFLIGSSEEPGEHIHGHLETSVEEAVDDHSLGEGVGDEHVPVGTVVIEGTIEPVLERQMILRPVSVSQDKEETSVEEQRIEHTVSNLDKHLRLGIITDPSDKRDDSGLDDSVNNNDETSDEVGHGKNDPDIVEVLGTDVTITFSSLTLSVSVGR
jgi:hypothetical protein